MSIVKKVFSIVSLVMFLIIAVPADAQFPDSSSFTDPSGFLSIKTLPANPGANGEVTASVEYYLTDLNKSEISWFMNGEFQKSGIGETSFKFKIGSPGSILRISVVINTFEGQTVQKEIILKPAEVDTIWNADTYTPPFYRGKALFTNKSSVTITAIPNFISSSGNKINPESLIYTWHKGNTLLTKESGIGKDTLTLEGKTISRSLDINVEVSTLDGTISASKDTEVNISEPKILIYEKNPLYGLSLNRALQSFELEEKEITLSAVPYFFNTFLRDSQNMDYIWTQNNEKINLATQESSIILRRVDDNLTGQLNVGVKAENKENQLQNANTSVTIRIM